MPDEPQPAQEEPQPTPDQVQHQSNASFVSRISITVLYALIPVGLIVFLGAALLNPLVVISPLKEVSGARGVITFIITLTTAGIALSLMLYVTMGDGGQVKERFDYGKQVLSSLIGILGTIVGFYFGSTVNPQVDQGPTLQFSAARINPPSPKPGTPMTISLGVRGGKPPYTYTITFDPPVIPTIKDARSEDGLIVQDVTIPPGVAPKTVIRYQIAIKDSENRTETFNKDGKQTITVQPP